MLNKISTVIHCYTELGGSLGFLCIQMACTKGGGIEGNRFYKQSGDFQQYVLRGVGGEDAHVTHTTKSLHD